MRKKRIIAAGIKVLDAAREVEPENIDVLYELGVLYEKNKETDKALEYMEQVLRLNPDQANALNFIGYSWAEKGINLDKAEEMIKKALALKPGDGYIQDSLGWLYYQKGDYKKATDELLKAHQKVPDDPVIAEHVGDAYLKLGDRVQATEFLQKSLKLDTKGERKQILEDKLKDLEKQKK